MNIVSIYPCPCDPCFRHEANVAMCKGKKIYAYEEAKLVQTKNHGNCLFPERSLSLGFKELDLLPAEVDYWVFPTPSAFLRHEALLAFLHTIKAMPSRITKMTTSDIAQSKTIVDAWFKEHVRFIDHSLMHAGLAVYTSPKKIDVYFVMDGGGDEGDPTSMRFGWASKDMTTVFAKSNRKNLGKFHTDITDLLGFSFLDNGKVSGLAGYGRVQESIKSVFYNRETLNADGYFSFDRGLSSRTQPNFSAITNDNFYFVKAVNVPPGCSTLESEIYDHNAEDIAATCESYMNERVLRMIDMLFEKINVQHPLNLAVAGGVFNNVRINAELSKHALVSHLHTSMAPGDSGLALGGLLFVYNQVEELRVIDPYLGPSFSDEEIEEVINRFRLNYQKLDDICIKAANLLAEGAIIGWFQGRGEYGPRSLGTRSILADPRSLLAKERVNNLVKRRDWFMPFAPAVLESELSRFTEFPGHVSPYMQVAVAVNAYAKKTIPSGVHVDGTARIQSVKEELCPKFYQLINEFQRITGVPAVLNTSFNRHGIATISTPRHAIEHLLEGCIDCLIINNYLIDCQQNRKFKDPDNRFLANLTSETNSSALEGLNENLRKKRRNRKISEKMGESAI